PCRPVHRRSRRALGLAPALEDQDVEGVEEFGDLLRERGAAGDPDPQPSAELRLDLRVDEPVGEAVLEREAPAQLLAPLPRLARPAADLERPGREPPPHAGQPVEAADDRAVDLLVDARDA